jgi:L-amino acid N-acyltransferase YncA
MESIRTASEEDALEIFEIYKYYVNQTCVSYDYLAPDPIFWKEKIKSTIKINDPFLVTYNKQNKITGFGYLYIYKEKVGYKITRGITIYFSPNQVSKGMGKVMLNELLKKAKENGYREIIAEIDSENKKSIDFFEKNNFVLVGFMKDIATKFDKFLSVSYMKLSLNKSKL